MGVEAVAGAPAGIERRVGIIDIGSNSIRLVIYDRLGRAPLSILNHKAVIGLGTDVEQLGYLGAPAFRRAVDAIDMLVRTARGVPVARLDLLATAAVRVANNGGDFCESVKARTGCSVEVLSGTEEARLSALGVVSARPGLTGVVGDLGGGSLELVALRNGRIEERASLDIGPLRLIERTGNRLDKARQVVARAINRVAWLPAWRDHEFHAVGGAWRAIARLHMAHQDHPLRIVHGYRMTRHQTRTFIEVLEGLGPESIAQVRAVSSRRAETLPWGSVALEGLIETLRPGRIVFSAHGLREGHHFHLLDAEVRDKDPLLAACMELANRHRRFPDASAALEAWLRPLTERLADVDSRLVSAACMLADMGWSEHPEYRAEQSMSRVLHMPWSVLDHAQRAFLALAVFVRYGGSADSQLARACRRLLDESGVSRARALGKVLRLAMELCAGNGTILEKNVSVSRSEGGVVLFVEPRMAVTPVERIERYAASASRALELPVTVERRTAPLTESPRRTVRARRP